MDNPFNPQDRLVETSRVGHFFQTPEYSTTLPLDQTVVLNLAAMPNLTIEEGFPQNMKPASTQVSLEVRCTGHSKDTARILGRINPIPLSDINGQPLDCWVALQGGEADTIQLLPGQAVPQVPLNPWIRSSPIDWAKATCLARTHQIANAFNVGEMKWRFRERHRCIRGGAHFPVTCPRPRRCTSCWN
jgi:hypothetical protein